MGGTNSKICGDPLSLKKRDEKTSRGAGREGSGPHVGAVAVDKAGGATGEEGRGLGDQLVGELVGAVDVVAPGDDDRDVE